ncbi:Putative urea carboxylase [Leucoagaricus sp. SymC.cos]|nr:Putative urea carboxylase [Leucoagaricus sp. SymC.cos]
MDATATEDDHETRQTLLIANRGEIAVRIIRTAKKMGIRTVSVYTPADAVSPHVTMADISVALPLSSEDSNPTSTFANTSITESSAYLSPDSFLEICKVHDVTLLHPGYGFLSENAEFANMVTRAGVTWLGPSADVIRDMGLKHEARRIVKDVAKFSGDPELELCVVPGSDGLVKDGEEAEQMVRRIGLPVLFKASAGGGGLGMVVCERLEDVVSTFDSASMRAKSLFGNAGVLIERYFPRARHIEVQVFGDGEGNVIHLGERECSIQRRHQKVIEESPSPFLEEHPGLRAKVCDAAVALCRSIQYDYAGTVEFLVDDLTGEFYFLEMNTRLQVEHPVTEMVYSNLDLVELMIRHGIAKRNNQQSPLDFSQNSYERLRKSSRDDGQGHAIEGRLYAENPAEEFISCPGLLQSVDLEKEYEWLRVDSWISTGMEVTPHFDPLLAKITVYGSTREEAISRFVKALEECHVYGPPNNMDYLRAIAISDGFQAGRATTKFLENFRYTPRAVKVIEPGLEMTIQDLPGRTVGRGVPCSGPMDPMAFSIGNILVGNPKEMEGIELIIAPGVPACLRFLCPTLIAVTGRDVDVSVDDGNASMWSRVVVPAGGTVTISMKEVNESGGLRVYVLIKGGFPHVPRYLGSKSTSVQIGGYQGRPLAPGDFLALEENGFSVSPNQSSHSLSPGLIPQYPRDWIVYALPGPHDDEEFVTPEGIAKFYSTRWQVSPSSNRMGIRLESPEKIQWARTGGGEGGAHPSNILDNAYALGSVNINGDTPVILTNEGPDMGGYVCLCTVATGELWKLGQLAPGCTVQFRRIPHQSALDIRDHNNRYMREVEKSVSGEQTYRKASLYVDALQDQGYPPLLNQRSAATSHSCVLRQAGDMAILVEFGEMKLDFLLRARVQVLLEALKTRNHPGLKRLSPCIRSLMVLELYSFPVRWSTNILLSKVYYDPDLISQPDFVQVLLSDNESIPANLSHLTFSGRKITFPIVLDDPWSRDATSKYMQTVREKAVYLPSNVEYLARNNGLASAGEALKRLASSDWIAFGVGFYLACPFLVPLDPRSQLVGQKLNPSRTFTPRATKTNILFKGAVGIAGPVTAIYPVDSPGGYQLFGRTLPPWQTWGKGTHFSPNAPWLLEPFDQLCFEPVNVQRYEELGRLFDQGRYVFKIEPTTFSMEQYKASISAIESEMISFRGRQRVAQAEQAERERAMLLEWERDKASRSRLESNSTEGHWHGFFQPRTSDMDGPAFVTQCPISPNSTFIYDFETHNQSGNFWYHSHLSTQYCDGLRGAIAIHNPDDPLKDLYDVDDEGTIITLADWYHSLAPAATDDFFTTGVVPIPDSGLINGKGRFNGGPETPFAVVNVEQGKRYRLRVFAISCRPFFTFSIDSHNLTFIEADGIEHDPVDIQNVDVYAAQRVSVILNATQPVNNYWIRAPPTGGDPAGNPNFNPNLTLAILRYKGAPNQEPTTVNVPGHKLLDQEMHPIAQEGPGKLGDGPPDVPIVLNIAQPNPPFFDINGVSYISPTVPVLLQILSGAKQPQDLLPSEQVFVLPRNKIVQVSIPGGGAHPFHLHGHAFDVVLPSNDSTFNFVNPLRRDVYPINGGNTTFRWLTDNPGAWFLHCHIDWHLEAGLAVAFAEAPEDNVSGDAAQITPQDWLDLCPQYDQLDPELQ